MELLMLNQHKSNTLKHIIDIIIMFVNQDSELKTIEREYQKKTATFTVIYVRRRVGKTALIYEHINPPLKI
jgi:AAA+ ATPase superfamily predicted ATPase